MKEAVAIDLFQFPTSTPADLEAIHDRVRDNVSRVRVLGNWPAHIDGERSLVSRIPSMLVVSSGFDAGIACALDMIPRDKQRLSAILHAAYTEAAVEQVRHECIDFTADSETCWWLAASAVCKEGNVDARAFGNQLHDFRAMIENPALRATTAGAELVTMRNSFQLIGGIPFVIKDGGLQGAYISGYDWGVQYSEFDGLFFIGTFRTSLGLEDFPFSKLADDKGRPMSGPIHNSRQFVKVSSFQELEQATRFVRTHLGPPKK